MTDFKKFNAKNISLNAAGRSTDKVLTVTGGHMFSFNKKAVDELGVTGDCKLEFLQSNEDASAWSVAIGKDGLPFKLKDNYLTFTNTELSTLIKKPFECPATWHIRFKVVKDGDKFNLLQIGTTQPKSRK